MIAIFWALSAAILYGAGAALQQHQAATAPDKAAGRPGLLLLLMRRPWWLLGIAAELGGFATHAVALRSGPLTIVQMLLASSLIFSVATVHVRSGRWLTWGTWAAVGAVVAGVGSFVALTSPGLAHGHGMPPHAGLAAACLGVAALPFAVGGLASSGHRRALLLAMGAGLADACIAVVTMTFTHTIAHGLTGIATSWSTYALVIGGPCSLLLTQTAYQAGRPMISLPVITVVSPMASLAVGAGLLGETTRLGAASGAAVGLAVLVTATGLVTLARMPSAQPGPAPVPASTVPASTVPASTVPASTVSASSPRLSTRPGPGRLLPWPSLHGHVRPIAHQVLAAMSSPAAANMTFWTIPFPVWESPPVPDTLVASCALSTGASSCPAGTPGQGAMPPTPDKGSG